MGLDNMLASLHKLNLGASGITFQPLPPPLAPFLLLSSCYGRHPQPAPGWSLCWTVNSCTGGLTAMLQELLCFNLQVLTLSSWRTAAALHLLLTGQAHSCLLAPMTCAFPASEGAQPLSAARVPATTHRRCRAVEHGGCSACQPALCQSTVAQ